MARTGVGPAANGVEAANHVVGEVDTEEVFLFRRRVGRAFAEDGFSRAAARWMTADQCAVSRCADRELIEALSDTRVAFRLKAQRNRG